MALASELLWLEQLLVAGTEASAHLETVRGLMEQTEAVRDALYELYCDAADDRMATLVAPGATLEVHVRKSYAWCTRVVGLLAAITSGLRAPQRTGPDWAAAKACFREASALYAEPAGTLGQAVSALPIDFTSPIEPLRNLSRDLEQLLRAKGELQAALSKRFA
jgi:hypothetical protein